MQLQSDELTLHIRLTHERPNLQAGIVPVKYLNSGLNASTVQASGRVVSGCQLTVSEIVSENTDTVLKNSGELD
jgi:hypothetical protein